MNELAPLSNYQRDTLSFMKPHLFGELSHEADNTLILSLSILGFGILIIGGILLVLLKKGHGIGPLTVKLLGLIVVIIASIFLITAGYDSDQITPVIGLLGTIVGYLLSSKEKEQ